MKRLATISKHCVMSSPDQPLPTIDMMKIWTSSTGSRVSPSKSSTSNPLLRKTALKEKLLYYFCRESWEVELSKTLCMKVRRRDWPWLSNCWLSPRSPTCQIMKLNKSCSNSMKRSSRMLCMKACKVRLSHKLLMNCRKNYWDTLRKNVFNKRLRKLKLNVVKDRLKKLVEEMLKRSFAPENSVCMKRLSRWTKAQSIATLTGLSMTFKERLIDKPALWPTWENKKWINIWKVMKGDSTTTKHSSEIWFSHSCYPTCKEADCRRKCS